MVMLVTVDEGKAHLRVTHDLEDEDIEKKIAAASAAVITYLKDGADLFIDSSGEVSAEVPEDVQHATLLLLGDFYKNREPLPDDAVPAQFGYGYLPRAVTALLYPYRTPTIA